MRGLAILAGSLALLGGALLNIQPTSPGAAGPEDHLLYTDSDLEIPDLESPPDPSVSIASPVISDPQSQSELEAAGQIDPSYELARTLQIASWTIRRWNRVDESMRFDDILSLEGPQGQNLRIPGVSKIDALSGQDITGDALPDLVVHRYSGGAHCCFSTHLFSLRSDTTEAILRTPDSNCDGSFEDLDGDGVYEFLTCDDVLAYSFCPYAISPAPEVVLAYRDGQGYVPASPRFASRYDQRIELARSSLDIARSDAPADTPDARCQALSITMEMIYAGRHDEGWAYFEQALPTEDHRSTRAEVEALLEESPYYLAPEELGGMLVDR